jgi:hypothetical protein
VGVVVDMMVTRGNGYDEWKVRMAIEIVLYRFKVFD